MDLTLGLIHASDYLAFHLALGVFVFLQFIEPRLLTIDGGRPWLLRLKRSLSVSLAMDSLWMVLTASNMAESWRPADLWVVMGQTQFGHLWCGRVLLVLLLVVGLDRLFYSRFGRSVTFVILASLPLISARTGHAGAQEAGQMTSIGLVFTHSLAVAIWTGGLLALVWWLRDTRTEESRGPVTSYEVIHRFSKWAIGSTATVAVTGLTMAYRFGITPKAPLQSTYGRLCTLKLALFVAALAAAAINQFVYLRRARQYSDQELARRVRREVLVELLFIAFVFVVAGFLTRTMPPVM